MFGVILRASVDGNSDRERYQQYLCSREWGLLREAGRKRSGGICERCRHFPMSHVHHLVYIRKYNERLEDLRGLCEGCHEYIHGKQERACLGHPQGGRAGDSAGNDDPELRHPWMRQDWARTLLRADSRSACGGKGPRATVRDWRLVLVF
jgi:hypothetical protein